MQLTADGCEAGIHAVCVRNHRGRMHLNLVGKVGMGIAQVSERHFRVSIDGHSVSHAALGHLRRFNDQEVNEASGTGS